MIRLIIQSMLTVGTMLLLLTLPVSCKTKTKTEAKTEAMKDDNRFHWGTGISVPSNYPAYLISGGFFTSNGGGRSMQSEDVFFGPWGDNNARMGTLYGNPEGEGGSLLPNKLYVLWLSIAENKFYRGTFDLDSLRIREPFQRHFREHRFKGVVTGFNLVVGLAPEGRVTLWVDGGDKASQLEVGTFQAFEAPMSCVSSLTEELDKYLYSVKRTRESVPATEDDFLAALQVYRKIVMKAAERDYPDHYEINGVRHGYLDTCDLRYNSRITMVCDSTAGCITDEFYIKYANGEREVIVLDELAENPLRMRAVPREIHCYWSQPGKYRHYEIELDVDAAIAAYRKAASEVYEGGIDLQLNRNEEQNFLRLFLVYQDGKDSRKRVELKRANITNYHQKEKDMMENYETYKHKNIKE